MARLVVVTQHADLLLPELVASGLDILAIVAPCRKQARFAGRQRAMERFGEEHKIPVLWHEARQTEDLLERLRAIEFDLLVVCSYPFLLSKEVLETPLCGAVNLHPSLLPKYRGPDPLYWSWLAFEREVGVTLHFMDEGMDTGDIIARRSLPVEVGARPMPILRQLLGPMGKDLLVESLPALLERRAAREKQPQDSPTPMARLVPQGEILKQVRWESWTAEHAWHFLNGVVCEWRPSEDRPDEFRGLPALWRGFVWEFSDWSRDRVNAAPGAIVWAHKRWCVACSDGVVHFRRRFSWRRFLGR